MRAPPRPGSEASTGGGRPPVPDFGPLDDQANRIAAQVKTQIDSELASLRDQTNHAQLELFWESSMLIPLALAATLSFALGIGRPLRQVDRAITELGGGNFGREILVSGPVDLRRLGEQLEWLRGRLLDLAQERNRFLRHMSHELKTPLANIREGTELLMDGAVGALGAGQREVTAILQDNSIKLQRMIENLLSFSAWQSNSAGLDPSEFRIRPVVKQVLENQQLTLVSQRLRLDVKIDDIALFADRGKLRLILENLLSNAIKYSPRGGTITVRAQAERRGSGARGGRRRRRAFRRPSAPTCSRRFTPGARPAGTCAAPASACRWCRNSCRRIAARSRSSTANSAARIFASACPSAREPPVAALPAPSAAPAPLRRKAHAA